MVRPRKEGEMARYIRDVVLNKPDDFVSFIMNDYLQKNGFSMSDWKGEPAFRAGDAMMEGYKFLKWSYVNGVFHLEAWLKGTFGGEWNLNGFVGIMMKKPYRENLEQLVTILQQSIPQPMYGGQGAAPGGPMPNVIPVQTVDNSSQATQGLVFGILSVVFCWSLLFSIIFACLAFSRSRMGAGSSKANLAKTGKILAIVGICLAIALYIISVTTSFATIFS